MTEWARAVVSMLCGNCGTLIAAGEPVRVFRLPGVKRPKVRCQTLACAGQMVPPELPLLLWKIVTRSSAPTMTRLRECVNLPFDWKAAAIGEDR